MLESLLKRLKKIGMASEKLYRNTLKELFSVKNGVTASLLFFFFGICQKFGTVGRVAKKKKKRGWPYLKI